MIYDVAIIGGGPAGYTAAERAGTKGLKTILFEEHALGGVCLNEGCIPTKTLLYSAKLLDNFRNASKYGIAGNCFPVPDLGKIISRKQKIIHKLLAGIKIRLNDNNVKVVSGKAKIEQGLLADNIQIRCNEEVYFCRKLILCTGSKPVIPSVPGLEKASYWTSKEALENKDIPDSLIIIGGGIIGIEFASFFNALGVKVSLVEMLPHILDTTDREIAAMAFEDSKKKGIEFYLSAHIRALDNNRVVLEQQGEERIIEAAQILVSTGRKPDIEYVKTVYPDIETENNKLVINEYMQTSHPDIYACGDITGFSLLAHTAIREAEVAVNHISGIEDPMSYRAIPSVIYTNPEIAGVGKTEEEFIKNNKKYKVIKLPMTYSGHFVAENEMVNGLCKLLINDSGKIAGCHLYGNSASELISIAAIAIEKEFTWEEFRKFIFPHPTVSEIFHEISYMES